MGPGRAQRRTWQLLVRNITEIARVVRLAVV